MRSLLLISDTFKDLRKWQRWICAIPVSLAQLHTSTHCDTYRPLLNVLKRLKFLNMELRNTMYRFLFLNAIISIGNPFVYYDHGRLSCPGNPNGRSISSIYWHVLDKPFAVLHCTFFLDLKLRTLNFFVIFKLFNREIIKFA